MISYQINVHIEQKESASLCIWICQSEK